MLILGCKEMGRKSQGPFIHATGRGWVKQKDGQYKDALVRTRASVVPMIVETTGGLAPHSRGRAATAATCMAAPRARALSTVPATAARASAPNRSSSTTRSRWPRLR